MLPGFAALWYRNSAGFRGGEKPSNKQFWEWRTKKKTSINETEARELEHAGLRMTRDQAIEGQRTRTNVEKQPKPNTFLCWEKPRMWDQKKKIQKKGGFFYSVRCSRQSRVVWIFINAHTMKLIAMCKVFLLIG